MIWYQVRTGMVYFLYLLQGVVFAYVVLGWFMDRKSPVMRFLARIAEPMLYPVRRLMMRHTSSMSWSGLAPLVVLLLIRALISLLYGM